MYRDRLTHNKNLQYIQQVYVKKTFSIHGQRKKLNKEGVGKSLSESFEVELWNGQLLELVTFGEKVYFTQVLKIDQYIQIQVPKTESNVPLTVESGMDIIIYFYDEQKGMCTFKSRLLKLPNGYVVIKRPEKDTVKKIQRRRFFRVKVTDEMILYIPEEENPDKKKKVKVYTHDLSGGGISFLSKDNIVNIDDAVTGTLYLKKKHQSMTKHFEATIVNVIKHNDRFYRISLQFENISEKDQSDIISYCFLKQVEIRNKTGEVN